MVLTLAALLVTKILHQSGFQTASNMDILVQHAFRFFGVYVGLSEGRDFFGSKM